MIILFEGHRYLAADLWAVLPEAYGQELANGWAKPTHVGYLAPAPGQVHGHAVLLLPKVFVDEHGHALGDLRPGDLLDLPQQPALHEQLRRDGRLAFLFQMAVWLHRAISQFARRHAASELPEKGGLHQVAAPGSQGRSALELVYSLLEFHREHPALFVAARQHRARQARTVSWPRTVARQLPLLAGGGAPVYLEPAGKHPHRQYEEELLQAFSGTLHALRTEYGFRLDLPVPPQPEVWRHFRAAPLRRLREWRGRYFNDRLVRLWELLYLYYSQAEQQQAGRSRRERLLIRDFNIVFEDMIDYLLSDPPGTYPVALREQRDGKRVDHIYEDTSVVSGLPDTIYFIGDSKYYTPGNYVGDLSVYKQYTYARNVIYENIHRPTPGTLRYRDDMTEGYSPTPNFFLNAHLNAHREAREPDLRYEKPHPISYHFEGRLFDRDTLLVQQYTINFLYVLAAYVQNRPVAGFRAEARRQFRQHFAAHLAGQYTFWWARPRTNTVEEFVTRHFRKLAGQMYRPSTAPNDALLVAAPTKDAAAMRAWLDPEAELTDWHP